MKKTSLILSMALAFASCQQEELAQQEVIASPEDFVATVEEYPGATKTSLNEKNQILWSEDDQISIFNGSTANKLYQIKSLVADNRNATFTLSPDSPVTEDPVEIAGNVAVYPYQESLEVSYMYDEGNNQPCGIRVANIYLPGEQTYSECSFGEEAFPMVAVTTSATDRKLNFKNLLGVIKIELCGDKAVKSITLIGNYGESVRGVYTANIPYGNAAPAIEPQSGRATVKLNCGEGVQLNASTPTAFYIAIPPTTFADGFGVQIYDTEGNLYTRTAYGEQVVERSMILSMPPFVIGGSIDIEEDCVEIPTDGTQVEITVNSTLDWEATHLPEWVTMTPSSAPAGTTKVSISMTGDYAVYTEDNVYLEVLCGSTRDRVTILKELPISSCDDVIVSGTDDAEYRIKGMVTEVTNTLYGNFYIDDGTGYLYIYGVAYKGYLKMFDQYDIGVGDIVTIQGPRRNYNGVIELVNASVVDIKKSPIRINGISPDSWELPIEGTDFTINLLSATDDFTVEIPDYAKSWITVNNIERINDNEVLINFTADKNTGGDRIVQIMFECYSEGQRHYDYITLQQNGNIAECTLQEFLNAPVDGITLYRLTGEITSIANTNYGNFYISDGTTDEPVYVYGMTNSGEIGKNDKSFSTIGLEVGDIVTLVGTRTEYRGMAQVGGTAYYESHISK